LIDTEGVEIELPFLDKLEVLIKLLMGDVLLIWDWLLVDERMLSCDTGVDFVDEELDLLLKFEAVDGIEVLDLAVDDEE
jgi:hypothetical protein